MMQYIQNKERVGERLYVIYRRFFHCVGAAGVMCGDFLSFDKKIKNNSGWCVIMSLKQGKKKGTSP